jgi:hypothetical protein
MDPKLSSPGNFVFMSVNSGELGVRCQVSGVRCQETEDRSQRTELRGQSSDGRKQMKKSEAGRQRY